MDSLTSVAVLVLVSLILIGFFKTKESGYGRFNTSILIVITVLSLTALFVSDGKLKCEVFSNIAFAALGFAGGLLREGPPK